jgi:hypothetical protein
MNVVATVDELGLTLSTQKVESVSSILASRSKQSIHTFSPTVLEVFKGCRAEITAILMTLLSTRTGAEQQREVVRLFPKYLGLSLAISHFASAVVARDAIERLSRESICEMEADFRDKGLAAFGATVRSQALFTIWTLRKINEVVTQISAAKLDESNQEADRRACIQFTISALRAQMALDCLQMAMDQKIAIYPEVSDALVDDLRAMVNAYSWARQGLEARVQPAEATFEPPAMDDEDRQLLEAAFSNASELAEGL